MQQITQKAFAKINLTLEVLKKVDSGYHKIESVIQKISLCDIIKIEKIKSGIKIVCNDKKVPTDENNACWQIAKILQNKFKITTGVKIIINKKIPIGAGLGGGSSDAATVLLMLNRLWRLNLTERQMINISKQVGQDIAFFLTPKSTSLIQGLGEKVKDIPNVAKLHLVLIDPQIHVSTKWAYHNLTVKAKKYQKAAAKMIISLKKKDLKEVIKNLHNDFEPSVIKRFPKIGKVKKDLLEYGALASLMSGSGSSVYGIFESKRGAKNAYNKLRKKHKKIYLVNTI